LYVSSISMIIIGTITFIACTFITAPYGRYSTDKGWGFLLPSKLSWFLMESPNLWLPPIIYSYMGSIECFSSGPNKILLGMFIIHYIQRSIIYPVFRISGKNHQPTPVSVTILAFTYCFWNGFTQSLSLLVVNVYPDNWFSDPRFIVGCIIFITGFVINVSSDSTLLGLKGSGASDKKEEVIKSYKIPYGGLFEYVSCANYFGEILEWTGFAVACWSLPAVAFAFYTFCNLGPRAQKHHEWYQQKFQDYPLNRKAVIPFVW